jgi:hypothetical protein
MCRTSAPPRRDLYELEQSITTVQTKSAAEQGGFLVADSKPGRIAGNDWMEKRADHATAVWNGHYSVEGGQILWDTKPWCVMTPTSFQSFDTHAEALAYAFKENQ